MASAKPTAGGGEGAGPVMRATHLKAYYQRK